MKRLRSAFATGLLVLVPLLATIDILRWFFNAVDSTIRTYLPPIVFPFDFQGLGVIVALTIILAVGFLAHNFIGNWIVNWFDSAIKRISIVGSLYTGIKKFLETIFNPQSDQFKEAVLVQFPREGVYSIGFRTGKPDPKLTSKIPGAGHFTNVFVPCTPNPTSGFYLVVPEESLIPLDLSVQEAFKIVISMGIVTSGDTERVAHE